MKGANVEFSGFLWLLSLIFQFPQILITFWDLSSFPQLLKIPDSYDAKIATSGHLGPYLS